MTDDEILSIPMLDQGMQSLSLINACLVVDGRLQPEILHDAFEALVKLWPKLGARLVRNKQGLLEYHVPKTYSDDRPRFRFTVEEHKGHPIPNLPQRTSSLQPDIFSRIHLFQHASCPKTRAELLSKDQPIISIHINKFDDVTCVGVNIPHVLTDIEGAGIILKAWCSLMAGKTSEVPSLIVGDALACFGSPYSSTKSGEELKFGMLSSSCMWSTWDSIRFIFNIIPEFIFHPREQSGLFFLPAKLVASIRQKAMLELQSGDDGEGPWLSDNDIVTAILFKINSFSRSQTDKKLFYPVFMASMRGHIPCLPKDSSSFSIHNNALPLSIPPFPTSDLHHISIAQLALKIRNTIVLQRTVEQMEKNVTLFREISRRGGVPGFGQPNGNVCCVSSWSSAGLADLDFAPALEQSSPEMEKKSGLHAGKVLLASGYALVPSHPCRIFSFILSKQKDDTAGEGGYWCEAGGRAKAWPQMEEYLASLSN